MTGGGENVPRGTSEMFHVEHSDAGALFDVSGFEALREQQPARNRAKSATLLVRPPWASWRGSRVGLYVKFVESLLVIPKGNNARAAMRLHPYQRELFEDWLDTDARAAMAKIGRGNAKTTTLGALCAAHLFLEDDSDIPVVASTLTQASKTTYGAVLRFVALSPELKPRSVVFTGKGSEKIEVPANHSVCYPIADKPDGLQGLDPSIAVLDEAAFASQESWDALVLAAGKRPTSLAVGIGTPSDLPANAMLNTERALKSGANVPGFRWREWAAPDGCDHRDERVWSSANPGLVTDPAVLNIDALRLNVATSPEWAFRCYRLAQWPGARLEGAWLGDAGADTWNGLAQPWNFRPNVPTWAAVDMAMRGDSAAVVAAQYRPDGRLHLKSTVWYPGGGTVDPSEVMEHVRRLHRDFDVLEVGYDPRFFELPARLLYDEGVPMLEFGQSLERMTPAVAGLHGAIQQRAVTHDGDPIFTAQVLNAVPRYSDRGFTLSKPKSSSKIDSAVAAAMAHYLAAGAPADITDDTAFAVL